MINHLWGLEELDGKPIRRKEKIEALQVFQKVQKTVWEDQKVAQSNGDVH